MVYYVIKFTMQAQSKVTVLQIFKEGFNHRSGKGLLQLQVKYLKLSSIIVLVPDEFLASVAKSLDIQPLQAIKVLKCPPLINYILIPLFSHILIPVSYVNVWHC